MKYEIFKINSYSTFISVQILVVKLLIHADRKTVLIVSFLSIQVLDKKQIGDIEIMTNPLCSTTVPERTIQNTQTTVKQIF